MRMCKFVLQEKFSVYINHELKYFLVVKVKNYGRRKFY